MMKFLRRVTGLPDLTAKDVIEGVICAVLFIVAFYAVILLTYACAPAYAF